MYSQSKTVLIGSRSPPVGAIATVGVRKPTTGGGGLKKVPVSSPNGPSVAPCSLLPESPRMVPVDAEQGEVLVQALSANRGLLQQVTGLRTSHWPVYNFLRTAPCLPSHSSFCAARMGATHTPWSVFSSVMLPPVSLPFTGIAPRKALAHLISFWCQFFRVAEFTHWGMFRD